jgi:type IV pilus assembly protein PilE
MLRRRKRHGFTLVELMVVIVIVALLAAIAVPLYINYVKDARRSEGAGALAAVATGQQTYYQRNGAYANALASLNVDLSDLAANWTVGDPTLIVGPPPGFSVVATGKAGTSYAGLTVTMTYNLGGAKTLVDEGGKTM